MKKLPNFKVGCRRSNVKLLLCHSAFRAQIFACLFYGISLCVVDEVNKGVVIFDTKIEAWQSLERFSDRRKERHGWWVREWVVRFSEHKNAFYFCIRSCEIAEIIALSGRARVLFDALWDFIAARALGCEGQNENNALTLASLCVAGWDWRWRRRPSLFPWLSHFSGGGTDPCPQEQCQPVEENRSAIFCQSFWLVLIRVPMRFYVCDFVFVFLSLSWRKWGVAKVIFIFISVCFMCMFLYYFKVFIIPCPNEMTHLYLKYHTNVENYFIYLNLQYDSGQ